MSTTLWTDSGHILLDCFEPPFLYLKKEDSKLQGYLQTITIKHILQNESHKFGGFLVVHVKVTFTLYCTVVQGSLIPGPQTGTGL